MTVVVVFLCLLLRVTVTVQTKVEEIDLFFVSFVFPECTAAVARAALITIVLIGSVSDL